MTRLVVVGTGDGGPGVGGPGDGGTAGIETALRDGARTARVPVSLTELVVGLTAVRSSLRAAAATGEAAGLVAADLVAHPSLLGDTLDDPRRPVAALLLDDGRLGALRLDAAAASAAADLLPDDAGRTVSASGDGEVRTDPLDAVLAALSVAGVPVARVTPGRLVATRPGWAADARAAAFDLLASTSEHRARLAGAARPADGFYSTFVVRRLSRRLTGVAVRLGASPNVVTLVSLVVGLAAAALLTSPAVLPRVAGALLLQLSLVIDCVDGELARYARRFTPLGAWLDGVGDRVKEYAALAGLAVAAGPDGWPLAVLGLAVMTYRHVVDHHFTEQYRLGAPPPPAGLAPAADLPRETVLVWLRRILQFPVGERMLLLSVVAAVRGPGDALAAFAVACVVSAVWTSGGRVLRSLRGPGESWRQRLGWLRPGLHWLLEAAVVTTAFLWRDAPRLWIGYCLLAVVAYHAYDTFYRAKYRVAGPHRLVRVVALGHELRAGLVIVAAVLGAGVLGGVTGALAAGVAVLFGGESLAAWLRWLRTRPMIEEDR